MDNKQIKHLCINLIKADSEEIVITLLKEANLWENQDIWRYYGDRSSNYNTIGNQQGRSDASLVEKLVNSVDARLINECLIKGIDPEGSEAPKTIREAVALFFDNAAESSFAGLVRGWGNSKRTEIARGITLAATGNKPGQGKPCFSIADSGEGQTPSNLPNTILSLDRENKVKIQFVQGKFNMGGTGVLEFCGERNLQLVLSRRNPLLVHEDSSVNDSQWGFTVVRREDPVGGRKNSVYTYLAPVEANNKPNKGEVLSFSSSSLSIFPDGAKPYHRNAEWGTLIKVYEYSTAGYSGTNILLGDGLMRQLDILLPDLALPIRLHECRDYKGHSGSFATNLTGLAVRLEDEKQKNLEDEPYSFSTSINNEMMRGKIYVFKKNKANTYRSNEGVVFSVNGQTHGYLPLSFLGRKKVGMKYIADSLLVTIDCSNISERSIELLFMPSRDRLRKGELKLGIEKELTEIISTHPELKRLKQRRRDEEVEEMLDAEKPLGEILQSLIKDSPTLTNLFLTGTRLSNPFDITRKKGDPKGKFIGIKFPTFFKFKDLDYGQILERNCHLGQRVRVVFETDVENIYFDRDVYRGEVKLLLKQDIFSKPIDGNLNLSNGIATLNFPLPSDAIEGDLLELVLVVTDSTQIKPFKNQIKLQVLGKRKKGVSKPGKSRYPPSDEPGDSREIASGVELPTIIKVGREKNKEDKIKGWEEMTPAFDEKSALRVIHAGSTNNKNGSDVKDIYDFYINIDNLYLRTEQKNSTVDADLLQAKFLYALVLLGLSVLNYDSTLEKNEEEDSETEIDKKIEMFSQAVAPVLIPIINELGGLELDD